MKTLFVSAYLGGIGWLAGWEIAALMIRGPYTLSNLWWHVEGTGFTAARYATVAGLTFLTLHLAFGLFR